jgi:hypothetical protein
VDEKTKLAWEKLERAKEEKARRLQEFRDRSFEVQKHVATLSLAASLLILAVYRERPFELDLLAVTLGMLATSAVIAIHGMNVQARDAHLSATILSYDEHISWTTNFASNFLILAVVTFALFLFNVPFRLALGVVGVVAVVRLVIGLIRW